jgi:hypothetical protein
MYQISLLHNLYISSAEHVQEKLPAWKNESPS